MTRTDVHRPAELVPEDYEEVGWYDLGGTEERPVLQLSAEAKADDSVWGGVHGSHLDRCDHCGAWLRYGAELVYLPTGQHIHVGETCLGNRFSRSSAQFHAMRKAAELDRQGQRLKVAALAFRADHDEVDWAALDASTNSFVVDVLRKLRSYGSLSDRQLEAIQEAVAREARRATERAAEEATPKAPVPAGRQRVTGEIAAFRSQDSRWGTVSKMLLKVATPAGEFRLWGTLPRALEEAQKGDKVTIEAELQPSGDDPSFGFFSRPRVVPMQ